MWRQLEENFYLSKQKNKPSHFQRMDTNIPHGRTIYYVIRQTANDVVHILFSIG